MNYYLNVLKNYKDFAGRTARKEFWMFVLINFLISLALSIVLGFIDHRVANGVQVLYSLFVLVPSIAVNTRRLHDVGKSGWWQLIALIPIVGIIILIVFLVADSEAGDNMYGPNPKGGSTPISAAAPAPATVSPMPTMSETAPAPMAAATPEVPPAPQS